LEEHWQNNFVTLNLIYIMESTLENLNLEKLNAKELQTITGGADTAPILIGGLLIGAA
jgi:bacteriocin-like protein